METEYRSGQAGNRTWLDWLLEAAALVALVAMFVWVGIHWSELPDRAPKHWNLAGEPDAWSGKRNLWLLPVLGAAHYLLLTVLAQLKLAPEAEPPAIKGARIRVLTWVKASMLVSFAYINWTAVNTALGQANGLGRGFIPAVVVITVLPAILIWRRMRTSQL